MNAPMTPLVTGVAALLDRAVEPGFDAWRRNIVRLGGCTNPVHLVGSATVFDARSGEALLAYASDAYGGRLLTSCGNRRSSVCPTCARVYQADTYQLIRAGLVGGKDVTEEVGGHPGCSPPSPLRASGQSTHGASVMGGYASVDRAG